MSTSPKRTMKQLDLSMYLFIYCDIMKCLLGTTKISNLDDSYSLQYSCHLCTTSTLTTIQECDRMLSSTSCKD